MKHSTLRSWVVVLAFLSSFAAAAAFLRFYNHQRANVLVIVAVAHEWWWDFQYPSLGIAHESALHLPVGIPIHLKLISADAIHSFWLPGLEHAVAIVPDKPGELDLTLTSPGHLVGNCDAGCGCGTVCMRFAVLADDHARFNQWLKAKRADPSLRTIPHKNTSPPPCALRDSNHQASSLAANRLTRLLQSQSASAPEAKPLSGSSSQGSGKNREDIL